MTPTRFLSLPDELLSAIIEVTAESWQSTESHWNRAVLRQSTLTALSLVCRRVGRLAQTCLHVDIHVQSAIGLASLANTLHVRRDLRCSVKRLHIEYRARLNGSDTYGRGYIGGGYGGGYGDARTSSSAEGMYECAQRGLLSAPLGALKELELASMPRALLMEALAQAGVPGIVPALSKLQLRYYDKSDRASV